MKFIPEHFTKTRKLDNNSYALILLTSTNNSSSCAHVLALVLKNRLSWQPQLQHINSKLATLTNILTRMTALTWGASIQVSGLLYTAVVCRALTSSCTAMHDLTSTPYGWITGGGGGVAAEGQKPLSYNCL